MKLKEFAKYTQEIHSLLLSERIWLWHPEILETIFLPDGNQHKNEANPSEGINIELKGKESLMATIKLL
jgi:hypothetical protein